MRKEEWRMIPGYEGLYMVSSLGRVKSLNYRHTGKESELSQWVDSSGHLRVILSKNGKDFVVSVHRLVAIAFLPIPDKYKGISIKKLDVHHENFNPTDNRPENLRWLTKAEHIRLHQSVPTYQYTLCGEFLRAYDSVTQAATDNGISKAQICKCCNGKLDYVGDYIWKYEKTDKVKPCKVAKRNKPIEQYSLDGKLIKVWGSAREVERVKGFQHTPISFCCRGKGNYNTAYGYIWKYVENT